jgi:hypothetical protein
MIRASEPPMKWRRSGRLAIVFVFMSCSAQ